MSERKLNAYFITGFDVAEHKELSARVNNIARHGWRLEHAITGIGLIFGIEARSLEALAEALAPLCASAEEFHERLGPMLPRGWESACNRDNGVWLRIPSTETRQLSAVSTVGVSWAGGAPDKAAFQLFLKDIADIARRAAAGEFRLDEP